MLTPTPILLLIFRAAARANSPALFGQAAASTNKIYHDDNNILVIRGKIGAG